MLCTRLRKKVQELLEEGFEAVLSHNPHKLHDICAALESFLKLSINYAQWGESFLFLALLECLYTIAMNNTRFNDACSTELEKMLPGIKETLTPKESPFPNDLLKKFFGGEVWN